MAEGEMSPYSGLEFAFLLLEDTDKNLSYFRRLSKLLEIRIINFGETHFPIFEKLFEEETLQSPTPKGLSLTGSNTPLGKPGFYELIATPEKMAQFHSPQWLKDDIIVVKALSMDCYIAGDQKLLDKYHKAKKEHHTPQKKSFHGLIKSPIGTPFNTQLAMRLLEGHLQEFKPEQKQTTTIFKIKKELYRPFQSILESITLFAKLPATSTLNMIGQLLNKKIICPEGAKHLTQALHHVLNLRLETHLFYQHGGEFLLHQESIPNPRYLYLDEKKMEIIHEIYQVLIPFHKCAEKFFQTQDPTVFAHDSFYDKKLEVH